MRDETRLLVHDEIAGRRPLRLTLRRLNAVVFTTNV